MNGNLATANVATLDTQRRVGVQSAGDLSAVRFIINGTDDQGHSISQNIAGPNAAIANTSIDFKTITGINTVGNMAGVTANVGTIGVGASAPIPLDQYVSPFAISLFMEFPNGTVNGTVQYTTDDIFNSSNIGIPGNWTDHSSLTNKSSHADSNLAYPASAIRLVINSGSGVLSFRVLQAGIAPNA